jgi:hypothetical protein
LLIFGMMVIGCDNGSTSGGGYTPTQAELDAAALAELFNADDAETATVSGTTVTLVDDVTLAAEAEVTIPAGVTLVVSDEVELTVEGAIDIAGAVTVAGTLTHASGSTADLTGTITVEDSGVYKDLNSGGGTVWAAESGTGTITWNAGAKGYVGGSEAANLRIGGSTDPDTTTLVKLATGTLENTKTGYELAGAATVRGNFGLTGGEFKITSGTLTVDIKWQGAGRPSINDFTVAVDGVYIFGQAKITGETGASIEVKTPSGGGSITGGLIYIDNDPGKIFYSSNGTKLTDSTNVLSASGNNDTTVPAGTYNWTANLDGSTGGWKAEAEE